jgi:hypothetical protein
MFLRFITAMAVASTVLASGSVFALGGYPMGPDPGLTPGSVCQNGNTSRYPEHVRYCERDVGRDEKQLVFRNYDQKLGYSTQSMNRQLFKIDHFIPLCAGGSNNIDNLWPQHESIFNITDPLEPAVCGKMSAGRLKQAEAIELIRRAKLNLDQVGAVMKQINSL